MDMAAAEQMRPNEESGASRVLPRRQERLLWRADAASPAPTRWSSNLAFRARHVAASAHGRFWHKADIPDSSAFGAKRTSASDCLPITIY